MSEPGGNRLLSYEKMLALLAACLWLAGCSGDGPDGGSGNLNIVFDCSMPLQVVAGETCEVGYTLEGRVKMHE